ncbi:MAG: hypothetical protein H6782_04970 [Candidatus Nomurabacteria bacterium]|nr:MAG: hypothetical protein H6782_04970 [Candidatus Nomurabacteria bacterium]
MNKEEGATGVKLFDIKPYRRTAKKVYESLKVVCFQLFNSENHEGQVIFTQTSPILNIRKVVVVLLTDTYTRDGWCIDIDNTSDTARH